MGWQKIKEKTLDHIIQTVFGLIAFLCGAIYLAVPPATWAQIGAAVPKRALAAISALLLIAFLISLAYIFSLRRIQKQNQNKVSESEARIPPLQERISELNSQYQAAEIENRRLQKELEKHTFNIDADAERLLRIIANPNYEHTVETLAQSMSLHPARVRHYLGELEDGKYIYAIRVMIADAPTTYHLDRKGTEYLLSKNLI